MIPIKEGFFLFSNLLFLILILLMINFSGELPTESWPQAPLPAFMLSLGIYIAVLTIILVEILATKKRKGITKNALHWIVNCELLIFLGLYYFILGGQRLFGVWMSASALFSLSLYFCGLLFFHFAYSKLHYAPKPLNSASQQVRLILPFAIPFLLFTLLLDVLVFVPNETLQNILVSSDGGLLSASLLFFISLLFMGFMFIFLPPVIVSIWQCEPIEASPLKERLEALCAKAHFKHGGMLYWTIMNQSLTAAIVGVVPRLRYVMFTKRLFKELSPNAIEAILAHEIGHSYRKHLLIYPVILLGMLVCTSLFSVFFSDPIASWFSHQNAQHPSALWTLLYPLALFIPYALIIGLYFRFVFGLFSRLFERQADLHGFELGLPPEHMIEALNDVAVATGFTHLAPNWHHYSIQERMDFLKAAAHNPAVIQAHHRRVKLYLIGYLILLTLGTAFLLAPYMPDWALFKSLQTIK